MTYLFKGKIELETIRPLIEFIDSNPGPLEISINSHGGETAYGHLLQEILDKNKDRITLYATSYIGSAAFEVFYTFKGKKAILQTTYGMYHYGSVDIAMSEQGKFSYTDGKHQLKTLMESGKLRLKIAKSFMNKKELKNFKKNRDVSFDYNRLKEICNV